MVKSFSDWLRLSEAELRGQPFQVKCRRSDLCFASVSLLSLRCLPRQRPVSVSGDDFLGTQSHTCLYRGMQKNIEQPQKVLERPSMLCSNARASSIIIGRERSSHVAGLEVECVGVPVAGTAQASPIGPVGTYYLTDDENLTSFQSTLDAIQATVTSKILRSTNFKKARLRSSRVRRSCAPRASIRVSPAESTRPFPA